MFADAVIFLTRNIIQKLGDATVLKYSLTQWRESIKN